MRKRYLKERHPVLFSELLLSGRLFPHLVEIDRACEGRIVLLVKRMPGREVNVLTDRETFFPAFKTGAKIMPDVLSPL